ncbi:MAG: hypothetical protein KC635_28870, partial [Myxococcales bacterium]|nr:hypothetical protein [Myxococcales bacterium]
MPVAPPRRRQLLAVLALAATLSACASAPAPRSGDADPRQADNAASGEPRRHVAMVLLSEPRLPPGDAVGAAYREMEHLPPAATPSQVEGDKQVMSVVVEPGVVAAIGLMPMPVPDGEADELAKYSVAVVGGLEELAPHRAHLVVLLTDERSATAFESASRLISLLAAIAEATPSVGV